MGACSSSHAPPPAALRHKDSLKIAPTKSALERSQGVGRASISAHALGTRGRRASMSLPGEADFAKRNYAATKIQALFRRHQMVPAPVSLRVAATQSWRSLPRDKDGKVFPLFSSSLIPLSYVQGVGNILALRFELEIGLVFLLVFALHYAALRHNVAGQAITERDVELPFPSAAGSLGNATSLEAAHGLGDAVGTVFLTVMAIALRRYYNAWQYQVDDELITVADYAVAISGLPKTATSAQLSTWIRGNFPGVQLVGVTLALDEKEMLHVMRELSSLRMKATDLARSMILTKTQTGLHRHELLLGRIAQLEKRLSELRAAPKTCTGTAFVVFNRMSDAQQVINEAARHPFAEHVAAQRALAQGGVKVHVSRAEDRRTSDLFFVRLHETQDDDIEVGAMLSFAKRARAGGIRLHAVRAPEPSDVLWQNLHMGAVERASRRSAGLALSLAITAFSTIVMGIARFIQPVYGHSEQHRVIVRVAAPACIVIGNLAINISVPRIAEYEGWQNATLRNDSLCVKLAVFQVLNSLAGAVMMFVYEGYTLTSEWYRMAGQMASAIMIFTMIITDSLGLLRLAACLKRVFAAPFARTQAYANRAFQSADPMYLAKRISLILKYVIIAMMLGPFFPVTYLLAAIGCILSYGLDKFNMLRQLPALPKNHGHLIVTTILGRVLPICLVLHVPIAILAYNSRAHQLVQLYGTSGSGSCGAHVAGHDRAAGVGTQRGEYADVGSWLADEKGFALAACNHAVLYVCAGGILVLAMLLCDNLSQYRMDRTSEAPTLGNYARIRASGSEPLRSAQDGLRLYISPTQQQALLELASRRNQDPLTERSAFTGDSVALGFEAFASVAL